MAFNRLVVHVGAPKTASTAIQSGLFRNRAALRAQGVHLPEAGRLELEPRGICHHHLSWQITAPERFSPAQGGWDELAAELADVDTDTVVLSSEDFYRALLEHPDEFERRLRALCDDITVVVCVRDQISLINSIYGQTVKSLVQVPAFPAFARRRVDEGTYDYDAAFSRWYDAPGITVRAVPFGSKDSPEPLAGLLEAGDIPTSPDVELAVDHVNASLGPYGIEATLLLSRYLKGRFPEFDPHSLNGRMLHRAASRAVRERGWCQNRYWGWTPELAREMADRIAPGNARFAQVAWGTDWPFDPPVDRPQATARLEDIPPHHLDRINRFVLTMAERYQLMLDEGNAPA